jgi:hypothetical protein
LAGGALVVIFAVISEMFQPKRFAGIFAAAPSILLASLIVTILFKGTAPASLSAFGAIAGATGLVACALAAIWTVDRWKGLGGSVIALIPWAVVSLAAYLVLMEGK